MVQLMPLHPKTPSFLASFKSRLGLPFWYRLTKGVLEKRPLNGCSSSYNNNILRWIRLPKNYVNKTSNTQTLELYQCTRCSMGSSDKANAIIQGVLSRQLHEERHLLPSPTIPANICPLPKHPTNICRHHQPSPQMSAPTPYCPRKHLLLVPTFLSLLKDNLHRQKYTINNITPSDAKYKQSRHITQRNVNCYGLIINC